MTMHVKPLLDLPESIYGIRSEFVEKLTEAVERPKRTAETYVVTSTLAEAFEKALKIVGASLRDARSRAAFLHGSFGSGKRCGLGYLCVGETGVFQFLYCESNFIEGRKIETSIP